MDWVRCLSGSSAWTGAATNTRKVMHQPSVTANAAQAHLKRGESGRREVGFPMLVLNCVGPFTWPNVALSLTPVRYSGATGGVP